MTSAIGLSLALLSACTGKSAPATDDSAAQDSAAQDTDTGTADETACAEAEARLGYSACVPRIADDNTFETVTVAASTVDQIRVGKYLVPAIPDARVPPVFLDVNNFPMHYDFLVQGFPDAFAALTTDQYEALTLYPETREFYAGTISLYVGDAGFYYGFTVWDDPADAASTVTQDDVTAAWQTLTERFSLGDLVWVPNSQAQAEAAQTWEGAPFDIEGVETDLTYEVYDPGEAYGTLRLYTLDELDQATQDAAFGYQDILAIDEAPSDLERVVSGIITGTRQGELSHLSVRSASRGTPNCYIADPLTVLADWEGKLVHFTCGQDDWSIEDATAADAEAWWASIRPEAVPLCAPLTEDDSMPGLLDLPTDTSDQRQTNICTFGSKGSNLATMYQRIDDQYQLDGFLIPMHYYQEFMDNGTWTVDLGDGAGEATHTFTETLDAWRVDDSFLSDPSVRRDRLSALRDAMKVAPVDPAVVAEVEARILEVFGTDDVMVRFRSSSNAEDSLGFSGAGLYDSESGCVSDETDGDDVGPSWCDPTKPDEQTIQHAMRKVWASLWKMEAWDERDWYGMDQSRVAMGLLVDTRSDNEEANAVAFTGNPATAGDDRYLVDAQAGETEVVSADPGVVPESVLLTMDDGDVTDILRVAGSTEVEGGEVLTDDQLRELAGELYQITTVFPQDDVIPDGHDLLWDTEWKFDHTGQLKVKQIRPYLR